ncbi:MAG: thymidine kinase [Planctomycetota bacterium]
MTDTTVDGQTGGGESPSGQAAIGSITLVCGCMFSGKTTELLRSAERLPAERVQAFKPAIDTRYALDAVVSHAGRAFPATVVDSAAAIPPRIRTSVSLAAIDEGHFFGVELVEVVQGLARCGIDVVVAALDRDSWGREFPAMRRWVDVADTVTGLSAVCARCGREATRTQRLTPILDRSMVGGPESYEPRCEGCWKAPPEAPP